MYTAFAPFTSILLLFNYPSKSRPSDKRICLVTVKKPCAIALMTVIGGGEEGKKEINFSFKDIKYCLPVPGSASPEKFAESHTDSGKEQSQIPKPHFLPSVTYRENFTKLQKYGTLLLEK